MAPSLEGLWDLSFSFYGFCSQEEREHEHQCCSDQDGLASSSPISWEWQMVYLAVVQV
jgi:hypothetical protein